MSIIHDALKKAQREASLEKGDLSQRLQFRFSRAGQGIPWRAALLSLVGLTALGYLLMDRDRGLVLFQPAESLSSPNLSSSPNFGAPIEAPSADETEASLRWLREGTTLYRDGQLARSEEAFRAAIHLSPDLAVGHNNLGRVLRDQGRFQDAMEHYQEALRIDPFYAEATHNLGLVYERLGQMDAAIVQYRHALTLDPDFPATHYHLAAVLERKGDLSAAVQSYRRFLLNASDQPKDILDRVRRHLRFLEEG